MHLETPRSDSRSDDPLPAAVLDRAIPRENESADDDLDAALAAIERLEKALRLER